MSTLHLRADEPKGLQTASELARRYWPGPLTLVIGAPKGKEIGLRCPDGRASREVPRLADLPVFAPSANVTGKEPSATAEEVLRIFEGDIAAVVDGGETWMGRASTAVRVRYAHVLDSREEVIGVREV